MSESIQELAGEIGAVANELDDKEKLLDRKWAAREARELELHEANVKFLRAQTADAEDVKAVRAATEARNVVAHAKYLEELENVQTTRERQNAAIERIAEALEDLAARRGRS